MSVGLKDTNAGQDNAEREIRDKDNIMVGQMVVKHECLKVRAGYDGDFTELSKYAVIASSWGHL